MTFRRLFTLLAFTLIGAATALQAKPAAALEGQLPDVPFTRFRLPNGLTVVVSEDHKAPVVAVAVWYHVGAGREPKGKTGYAHLFEHLMFGESENHRASYWEPFNQVGATGMNGTTGSDRTNYFETVPTTALDMALWMESDRMGHLLGGLTKAQVDQQRGVVQNEKRQRENEPYGRRVYYNILANAYPSNHPYQHSGIGSMEDLNAASIDDFKDWFRTYYGAANATLVLVGDITPDQARAKALKYFGDIQPGPPVPRLQPWTYRRTASTRGVMRMDVPLVRIYREWNTPHDGTRDDLMLSLAASVLGGGKTSRLYQRLVFKDKLADNVEVYQDSSELASQFQLEVHVRKGVDPARVEAAVADEWQTFLKQGPSADELARAKTGYRASMVRRIEKVGGFSGKAAILAAGQVYHDDPGNWRKQLAALMTATPEQVRAAAAEWISRGDYTVTVLPQPKGAKATNKLVDPLKHGLGPAPGAPKPVMPAKHDWHAVATGVDRSTGVPKVTTYPDLSFPTLQHARLDNGIEVILAERHAIPVTQVELLFDAGYATDAGGKLGRASFTMSLLDEGTRDLDALGIAKRKADMGAELSSSCRLDSCSVSLDALNDKRVPSLKLMADIVRQPAFRSADMERLRGQWLARIAQEKISPLSMAKRVLPPLLYGKGHPYAMPLTGTGDADAIKALTRADLKAFMRDYVRPDNVRILVAGDTTLAEILPELNAAFGDWTAPRSAVPAKDISHVDLPSHPRVFVVDRPGSLQSLILPGLLAPSTEAPNHLAIVTMDAAFGGIFTSRLNMNLREDKHWAYGSQSVNYSAVGQPMYLLYAPVQTDKTVPAMKELLKEANGIIGDKPLTAAEIAKAKGSQIRTLPGKYQTADAVLGAMASNVIYHRPDDYVSTLKTRLDALTDAEVQAAAREVIKPDALTWVIVGDAARIKQPIEALDLGPVTVIDADGNPVED